MENKPEEWIKSTEAAKRIGVSHTKISKMAKLGRIKSKKDPRDERLRLVDINEVRRVMGIVDEE